MRVAFFNACDSRGGVLTYTLTLSAALRAAGIHVTIFTYRPSNAFTQAIVNDMETHADCVEILPPESNTWRDAQFLAKALLKSHTDVFVPNYRQTPYAAAALCSRYSSIKVLGVCHNDHFSYYSMLLRFEKCLSRLVCPSLKTATQLSSQLSWRTSDIIAVPYGVRITTQSCEPFTGGELRLIYHGRLVEEQKRISLILESARRLSMAKVPYHLTLIGDGPAKDSCLHAAQEPLLCGRISILDSCDWSMLSTQLVKCHVAILTSEYEGFCLSLAEGMGAGLPAVAFQCGGVIEQYLMHEQTGLLVAPEAITDFVTAIARLQNDPSLWSYLSSNARALIDKEYSWSFIAKQYVNVFEEVFRDPIYRRWWHLRPTWMPERRRSWQSVIDRAGRVTGIWQ